MAEQLTITITAKDGASQVFKTVGASASQMGDAVETAGQSGKKSISELSSELTTVGTAMTGVGAIMTASVVGPMIAGGKAAFNQVNAIEQATFALSAYGGSAEEVGDALQDLTAYAEDASRSGGIFWSEDLFAAAQNLVVMGAELDNVSEYVQIMSRSVGLGASSWDELGVVIGRVISTGRLAGNEFDELSKAGYRLDESLRNSDISARELFEALDKGIPADSLLGQADTISGTLVYLQGALIDVGQALLQVGEDGKFVTGGLGDQIAEGIGQARDVLLSMVPAAQMFGSVLSTMGEAASTTAGVLLGLDESIQTAAIALTGVGGAITLTAGAFLILLPRIVETTRAIRTLIPALATLRTSGAIGFTGIGVAATIATVAVGGMVVETRSMIQASQELDKVWLNMKLFGHDDVASDLQDTRKEINALIDDLGSGNFGWLPFGTGGIEVPAGMKADISDVLREAVTDSSVDYEEFFDWISSEIAAIGDDDDAKIDFLGELADPNILADFRNEIDETTDAIEEQKTGIDRLNESRKTAIEILGEQETAERDNLAWQTESARTANANREISLETQQAMAEEAAALREEQQKLTEEWIAAGLALAGYDDALSQINLAGVGNDLSGLAESLSVSSTALDNTFRIIVDNTNALGSQVQAVEDWALSLINVKGEYGQIDDLLASGAINLATYNAAQQAQVDISAANADVQEDLLSIQAQQAPVIADLTQKQAAYIAELSGLPEQQQLIALGWMDANTAAQANEAITLAAAAANGEMGDAGYAATTKMIEGAVAANPVLEALLTDIGLVARDHEGNLVINFDGAEGAKSDIDLLNESVRDLTDLLDDGVINGSIGLQVDGKEDVDAANAAMIDLDGKTANSTLNVDTGPSKEELASIQRAIEGLSGQPHEAAVAVTTTGKADVDDLDTKVKDIDGTSAEALVSVVTVNAESIANVLAMIRSINAESAVTDIMVTFAADDSDAQAVAAYWAGFQGTTIASVEVAITGNAGGPDGAQTVLDSFLLGGKTPLSTEVTITANATDATSALNGVASQMLGLDGNMATVTVTGDVNAAIDAVSGVDTQLANLNGNIATVIANADTTGATSGISGVASQLIGLDGNSATVNIYADTSDAVAGIDWAQGYNGAILATSYIDIVTRRSTVSTNPYSNQAHGGIAEFANGGVTARMGEVGPEMLHFADGGTAWAPHDGLYTVPPMTYVSPAPASVGQGGGGMTVNFNGNFYGSSREDLDDWARTSLIPAMTDAIDDQRRGQGGRW